MRPPNATFVIPLIGLIAFSIRADDVPAPVDVDPIEKLVQLLGSQQFNERNQAQRKLVSLGRVAVPQLERALQSSDREIVKRANAALAEIVRQDRQSTAAIPFESLPKPPDARQLDHLVDMLGSKDFGQRNRAQGDLVALGSIALARLERELSASDAEVARRASIATAEISRRIQDATNLVPHELPARADLVSADPYVRMRAMRQLACLGRQATEWFPEILRATEDWDAEVCRQAISALCTQRAKPEAVLPRLLAIARNENEDADVRNSAIVALRGFMPAAESTIPDLLALLHTKNCEVRPTVAAILGKIGAGQWPKVLPALLEALGDSDKHVRASAATGLSLLGKAPRRCVPAIHRLLREEKEALTAQELRRQGAEKKRPAIYQLLTAAGRFGIEAKEMIPTVLSIAKDQRLPDEFRCHAVSTLQSLGAVDELQQLVGERVPFRVRTHAALSLRQLGFPIQE